MIRPPTLQERPLPSDPLQNLNFLHLYYFWIVAREGGVSAACEHLHLTQPTISMQIRKLETALGHRLFIRNGRGVTLTSVGKTVFDYADEIFSISREMVGALRGTAGERASRLHVGILNTIPKAVTYRLLEPVLLMPQKVQIVCHEGSLEDLASDLARHRYDVVLSDTPISTDAQTRTYNHPLGETQIALCAATSTAGMYRAHFPDSVAGAPFLLPAANSEFRRVVDAWFDRRGYTPQIVGVFDDSALLKEFGQAGAGLFPVAEALLPEIQRLYDIEPVGTLDGARVRFYAVTAERKIAHPAVAVISQSARHVLHSASPQERMRASERVDQHPVAVREVGGIEREGRETSTRHALELEEGARG